MPGEKDLCPAVCWQFTAETMNYNCPARLKKTTTGQFPEPKDCRVLFANYPEPRGANTKPITDLTNPLPKLKRPIQGS